MVFWDFGLEIGIEGKGGDVNDDADLAEDVYYI